MDYVDVFKRNIDDGVEIMMSLDDAYMELCEYYDSFTIVERLKKGELLSTPNYVYEGLLYNL